MSPPSGRCRDARLALTDAARQVLANGLGLLGITAPGLDVGPQLSGRPASVSWSQDRWRRGVEDERGPPSESSEDRVGNGRSAVMSP